MTRPAGPFRRLSVEYADKLCIITLASPEKRNGLDGEMREELWTVVKSLAQDAEAHVVVLTGQGDYFSYGTFDAKTRAATPKATIISMVMEGNMLIDDLENLPQITIAAINGPARGSGVELSLACDLRYAADAATFLQHEADMGGFPGGGGPVRLPLAIGYSRAIEMICTARAVSATEAKEYGLVLDVIPDDGFREEVVRRAEHIASKGPIALRGAKRVAKTRLAPGHAEARLLSNNLRRELEWSQDVEEGIQAQIAGRRPVFVGR